MDQLLFALPAVPLVARLLIAVRFSGYMADILSEEALDLADHRSLTIALAGFSFTGLLGLVALPGELKDRQLAIWYVLVSFLALVAVLNLQGYKARRWHDLLGDSLLECASLALIASVTTFIIFSSLSIEYRIACAVLGGAVWSADFVIRIYLTISNLLAKEKRDGL